MLDAGDLFFSTSNLTEKNRESEYFRASAILDGYEKIGCDVINVGHYELVAGLEFLKKMDTDCNIPFISGNLNDTKTGKLLFDPYVIIEKNGLKVGIIGLTDMKPEEMKVVSSESYEIAGNKYINEIKNEVDIITILLNIKRGAHQALPKIFPDADFIYTSGSTHLTRPTNSQKEGGPYVYSFGKQGKYMSVITANIKDSNEKFVDVTGYENKIKTINRRLERLLKKDPGKPLKEVYAKQANILKLIEQYQNDLVESEETIKSAVNTLKFETLPLNRKIKDDAEMLAFVDKSLATCNALNKQPPKTKVKNEAKHHNHNHNHKHNHKHRKTSGS